MSLSTELSFLNTMNIFDAPIMLILPILVYIILVYMTMPYKSINLMKTSLYFAYGLISIGLVFIFYMLFPNWINIDYVFGMQREIFEFKRAFYRVAALEEITKFISFYILYLVTKNKGSLFSTMFYSGCVALGFAFLENITYVEMYGHEVLTIRAVTAVPLHMMCGMFMGYFIALGRANKQLVNHSIANILLNHFPKLKKLVFIMIGLFVAIFLHGLYDFNLFYYDAASSHAIMLTHLAISAILTFICGANLLKLDRGEKQ